MRSKTYFLTTGTIFGVVAVVHLLRIIRGWEAVIAGRSVPIWASWIGIVVAGYLAYRGYKLSKGV